MNANVTPGARAGMRFGVLVGFSAWIAVLGAICTGTGRTSVLLPVVLPLLLASLGLGALVLTAIELSMALSCVLSPSVQARLRLPLVLGCTLVGSGVLLLLADGFVTPVLQQDRELAQVIRSTGGVLDVPRWIAGVLLAAGLVASAVGLRRIGTASTSGCRQDPP